MSPPPARGPALVALLTVTLAACAGPTVTTDQYRGKVVQTAKAMSSIIATAQRAARLDLQGRMLHTVTDTVVSDSERDASSVQTTIESRQPPQDEAADELWRRIDGPVRDTTRLLTELRIAVRRNDRTAQQAAADALSAPLDAFRPLSQVA
ncbi:hypothetical protein FNH05_19945 [Amycolatopsis rhizosphaerae]|uniref:Histidine kinase n=1 Tax=Amycolatopsis rhizosphaerae TaxID=2053003 RepID=A0A558CC96_9PSEU|nr:hypothetical protein [Amycolatopsis rhizosphaerae]TVT46406.1 hypothetical protein FNH05_19945 [Amycolatopsis rhizosphaerae]